MSGRSGSQPGLVKVMAQGWKPETLIRVIEHFVDHPGPTQRSHLGHRGRVPAAHLTVSRPQADANHLSGPKTS